MATTIVKTTIRIAMHDEMIVLRNARGLEHQVYVKLTDYTSRAARIAEAIALLDQKQAEVEAYEKQVGAPVAGSTAYSAHAG